MTVSSEYRTEVGTVSFSVSFAYLTNLARRGWAEGRYQWAMDLLRDSGAPEESHKHIIRGKLKMVDNDDGSGSLSEDNWSPDLDMCAHGEYPDPDRLFELAERAMAWKHRLWEMLDIEYRTFEYQYNRFSGNGEELEHVALMVRRFPQDFIDSLPQGRLWLWNWAHMDVSKPVYSVSLPNTPGLPEYATDLDRYMEHEQELRGRPTPPPGDPVEVEAGWITPEGKIYPCGWNEHDWLAHRLGAGSTAEAEKAGWLRLGRSPVAQKLEVTSLLEENPAQAQLDTLFDWCVAHNIDLPSYFTE